MLKKMAAAAAVACAVTALVPTAAFASASGCNQGTCIAVEGQGLRVESIDASVLANSGFYGHYRIYGGGLDVNSSTGNWDSAVSWTIYPRRDLPNGSVLCVEAWVKNSDGGHSLRGRPCVEVRF
jgi:hypothetical protein